MADDRLLFQLAEHLLSLPVDEVGEAQRKAIGHALQRHRHPIAQPDWLEQPTKWHERLSDRVAAVGGSWRFITGFLLALATWTALNSWILLRPFDAYPYIFLNLLLSMLAAIQAPIIMMSQNRQAVRDRRQARRDFEINLKAELEILSLHSKLDQLLERSGGTEVRHETRFG